MTDYDGNNTSTVGTSTANAALTLTVAAKTGQRNVARKCSVAIRAAAAGADILVLLKDGSTVLWRDVIGNAAARGTRITAEFPGGLRGSQGTAMTLEIDAGGAACITEASLLTTVE